MRGRGRQLDRGQWIDRCRRGVLVTHRQQDRIGTFLGNPQHDAVASIIGHEDHLEAGRMRFQHFPTRRKVGIGVTGIGTPVMTNRYLGHGFKWLDGVTLLDQPEFSQLVEGVFLDPGQFGKASAHNRGCINTAAWLSVLAVASKSDNQRYSGE